MTRGEEGARSGEPALSVESAYLDKGVVSHVVHLPVPPDEVWPFLVEPREFARWYAFGGARIDPVPEGVVELWWDEHGIFHGQVREAVEAERFSFVLAVEPDITPVPSRATLVEFELSDDADGGALLTVRQSGYEQLDGDLGAARDLIAQDQESWDAGFVLLAGCIDPTTAKND